MDNKIQFREYDDVPVLQSGANIIIYLADNLGTAHGTTAQEVRAHYRRVHQIYRDHCANELKSYLLNGTVLAINSHGGGKIDLTELAFLCVIGQPPAVADRHKNKVKWLDKTLTNIAIGLVNTYAKYKENLPTGQPLKVAIPTDFVSRSKGMWLDYTRPCIKNAFSQFEPDKILVEFYPPK